MVEKSENRRVVVENLRTVKSRLFLIVVLDENSQILHLTENDRIGELFGFDSSQKNFRDFLFSSKILNDEGKNLLWQCGQTPASAEYDIDFLTEEKPRHFHFSFYPFGQGKIFLIRDETGLTSLKRELEAEKARLEKERDHYINDLNMLGHELRNPLATAGGFALRLINDLNREEVLSSEELRRQLGIIANEIKRMEGNVTNILETERMAHDRPQLRKEEVDMFEDVIGPVLEDFSIASALARKRIVIDHKTSLKPGQARLWADKGKCKILYRNLLDNVLRHIPDEGKISYGVSDEGEMWGFNFYNEGPIIPEEIIEQIFDKGFRGKSEYEGFGIGLFLIRMIVELHGGKIWAEKGRIEGANFIFQLPKK